MIANVSANDPWLFAAVLLVCLNVVLWGFFR